MCLRYCSLPTLKSILKCLESKPCFFFSFLTSKLQVLMNKARALSAGLPKSPWPIDTSPNYSHGDILTNPIVSLAILLNFPHNGVGYWKSITNCFWTGGHIGKKKKIALLFGRLMTFSICTVWNEERAQVILLHNKKDKTSSGDTVGLGGDKDTGCLFWLWQNQIPCAVPSLTNVALTLNSSPVISGKQCVRHSAITETTNSTINSPMTNGGVNSTGGGQNR